MTILVLAPQSDDHAPTVIEELKARGHSVVSLSGDDFPRRDRVSMRLTPSGDELRVRHDGETVDMADIDTVWRRRGEYPVVDKDALHPDDRKFAHEESTAVTHGLRDVSELEGTRWINPRAAAQRINNKPLQLSLARRAGLSTADTLISNDPDEIRAFYSSYDGQIIYKPLTPALFVEDGKELATFVHILPREVVDSPDQLKLSPGIYQPFLSKVFELRVNIFGDRILATRIDNKDVEGGKVDWRTKVHLTPLSSFTLPEWLETTIHRFMTEAGLVFGAMDFIVTEEGEFVFLEVNEMGQFLWLDSLQDTSKHLHAMCDLLGQAAS